jgi:Undecaprenyl-phosphate glucose phosphotransferase
MRLYWFTKNPIEDIFRRTWRSVLMHAILFMSFLFFSNSLIPNDLFVMSFCVMGGLFIISRFAFTWVYEFLLTRAKPGRQIAIVGYNSTAKKLADYLREQKGEYVFQGFFDDEFSKNHTAAWGQATSVVGSIEKCILFAREKRVEEIYSTILPDQNATVERLVQTADELCIRIKFVPDFSKHIDNHFYISHVGGFTIITLRKEPLEDIANRFRKRLFDIVISSFVMIFILSWLAPLLALLIKLDSRGPVFFRQIRSGRGNKPFTCIKFRSMTVNRFCDELQATKNDPRVTRAGAYLRKTNLDEFAQFFNVLKGDMSIVGPRPHMLKHTQQYSAVVNKFMVRHLLKPGITGWAQANGFRGETENPELMQKRIEHDLWYLENWSFMLDVKIVFVTIIQMLKGQSRAY